MSNSCSSCGISIPDGQKFCSMCYGDPSYGRDGYYENYLREQDRKREEELQEEAEYNKMSDTYMVSIK